MEIPEEFIKKTLVATGYKLVGQMHNEVTSDVVVEYPYTDLGTMWRRLPEIM